MIINVFFENDYGCPAELVAHFADEASYKACFPALERLRKKEGWKKITESVNEFDDLEYIGE